MQFSFLVLLVGLVLMRESRVAPLSSLETAFGSWLNVNARREAPPAPLTLVEISDEDLRSTPWPWSPLDYSLFLNATLPFRPPVLAIEPVLNWKKLDAQQIAVLHNQVLRAPKVLLGAEFGLPEDLSVVPPMREVPVLRHVKGDITTLPEFTLLAREPADEIRLAGTLGFENLADTNPVRRVPLVFRYRGQAAPSFVLQSAMLWFGVTADEVTVIPGKAVELGKVARIPVDARGTMSVDFGIPTTRFSMADLLLAAEQAQAKQKTVVPVAELTHRFTLLARTDGASRVLRFANGKFGTLGELFASAIATIQNREFVRSAPVWAEAFLILDALVLAWFCTRLRKPTAAIACAVVFCAYMLVALGLFAGTLIALPLVLPAGLIAFVGIFRQLD